MTDPTQFLNLDEQTITYERMMNALNESGGGVEGHATRMGCKREDGWAPSPQRVTQSAGIKPCPSEPFDPVEMELAFLKRDLDALISNLSNPETAARYAGYEAMLFSIQLSTDLIRSAAKADWPARARALADNVVDLRNYQGVR